MVQDLTINTDDTCCSPLSISMFCLIHLEGIFCIPRVHALGINVFAIKFDSHHDIFLLLYLDVIGN